MTSVPLRNVAPATTLGNWFSPFSLRQVFAAAITSLKTITRAVEDHSDPLVLTVLCGTVANTLSKDVSVGALHVGAQRFRAIGPGNLFRQNASTANNLGLRSYAAPRLVRDRVLKDRSENGLSSSAFAAKAAAA